MKPERVGRFIAAVTGIAALGHAVAALLLGSVLIGFVAIALAVAAAVSLSAAHPNTAPGRPNDPSPPVTVAVPDHAEMPKSSALPAQYAPVKVELVAPRSIDAQSVVDALFSTVRGVGAVSDATLWNTDSAADGLALVARATGGEIDPPAVCDGPLRAAHTQGLAVLETVTLAPGTEETQTLWRYAVPVNYGETSGVAAVDFDAEPPDLEIMNQITSAFRVPLAAALALTNARLESESARVLLESSRELSQTVDVHQIVTSALDRAMKITDAATGSIMLYQADGATLAIVAAAGLPDEVVEGASVRPGDGIAGWVALSGQPLVIEDMPGRSTPARSRGVRSAVTVPIMDETGILGVLNVGSRVYPNRFTSSHLACLEILARQVASALRNARAIESASELYFDTLRALVIAMETKDPYASGGTDRVMKYALELGRAAGITGEESHALEIAAMLHDIGMPSAGQPIFATDKPLTTVERGLLTLHPVIAADILDQAPALRSVAPIVYHHHERYDGSGYVNGLAGDDIPLGARVLSIADAFVAMTSERPYRAAMTTEEALAELRRSSGTQFDPVLVERFCQIVESQIESHSRRQLAEGRG